ncbi:MAG: leucyl/phenylalanyl-tRNA--protein transferase [Planctomycetota bacterium]
MAETDIRDVDGQPITPETVLIAYAQRCFPMADDRHGRIAWYRPQRRAIITWDRYKIPDSLAKFLRRIPYRITVDTAFSAVITACAARTSTWISLDVERLYTELHQRGIAHSVEAWNPAGELVGGLYGLQLGACFAGESMFHRANDASKACVVALVNHLRQRGFRMLDCQQQSEHMRRFGAYEISDRVYAKMLSECQSETVW